MKKFKPARTWSTEDRRNPDFTDEEKKQDDDVGNQRLLHKVKKRSYDKMYAVPKCNKIHSRPNNNMSRVFSTRCDFRVLLPMTSWFRLRPINPMVAITQSVDGRTRFPSGVNFAQNWRIFRPCIAQRNRARHEQLRSAPFSRMLIKSIPRQNLHWKAKINPETICHRGKRVGSPGESIILCQFLSGWAFLYTPRGRRTKLEAGHYWLDWSAQGDREWERKGDIIPRICTVDFIRTYVRTVP